MAEELKLLEPEVAGFLTECMIEASEGRFETLSAQGITVAGKTGSAEYAQGEAAHSWYLCFAPAENPKIAVIVLMESVGTGARYALPAAGKVLEEYFGD